MSSRSSRVRYHRDRLNRHGPPIDASFAGRLALWLSLALSACHATPHPAATPSVHSPSAVPRLRHDIDTILTAPGLERTSWGVLVRSLTAGDALVELNADKLMMPASALKIVTLAAAAERLGWNYTYETTIVADGTVRGDTVDGSLVVVGSGDPSLDRSTLESWTLELKARGIARVTGTVRADARAFDGEGLGFGWSWDDVPYYYAAPVAAAQFHENAVEVTLRPGPSPGAAVTYDLTPAGSGLQVDNRIRTAAPTAAPQFVARRAPGSASVILEGVMPAGSPPVVHALSVNDPPRYLATALAGSLVAGGIALGTEDRPPSAGPQDSTVLVTHRSAPLSVLARRLMEVSQNQYAETLIKTMGAQAGMATFDGGLRAVEGVLASWGIPAGSTILRDGSGLSRYDYVTPDMLVQVLVRMYRDPAHNARFFSALNVAAESGTLAARLKNTPAAGNARAKDGAMAGVRSLGGIVTTTDGEPLAFAILANNFSVPGPTIANAIDAIVIRLASFNR